MNDAFVCVKVDREERPDVDDVYMAAVQITTGRGGWPMTCFLLPDGRPFLARTYMRKDDLARVTARVVDMWTPRPHPPRGRGRGDLEGRARTGGEARSCPRSTAPTTISCASRSTGSPRSSTPSTAGSTAAPSSRRTRTLLFLLDRGGAVGGARGLAMVRRDPRRAWPTGASTTRSAAASTATAPTPRGSCPTSRRCSTTTRCSRSAYARGFAATKDPRYARVARDVFAWIEREMAVTGGGYASSLDADTDGEEGLTYTWTQAELVEALGAADAGLAAEVYGVDRGGQCTRRGDGGGDGPQHPPPSRPAGRDRDATRPHRRRTRGHARPDPRPTPRAAGEAPAARSRRQGGDGLERPPALGVRDRRRRARRRRH